MSLLDDVSIVVTPNGYKAGELYAVVPVPTEGAEILSQPVNLVTDFVVNSGGVIVDADTFTSSGGAFDGIKKSGFLTIGKRYKLIIEGNTTSSGFTLGILVSGNEYGSAFGTHYFTATTSDLWIRQQTSGTTNLTSFSIKEYTSADMDVTRATAATRVDEAGLVNYAIITGNELVTNGNFSQEGAEKVTNGDFSVDSNWNQVGSNGWSINTGTSTLNFTNASSYVFQGISTVSGKSYKVTLDIELNSGTIVAKSFSAQDVLTVTSTGRQTLIGYFKEGDSNANFGFVASGSASGKIHSVSVKEVGADWNTGTGVTIGSNVATFTSTPSGQSVQQNAVATALPNGSLAKVSFEVLSRTEGSFGIYFSGTLVGSKSSVGVFTAYFTKGTETSFYIRALGTTSGTISNVSVIEEIRNNVPRIDYTGGSCPHILAEPQRTNLLTYSEDFSNAIWQKQTGIVPTYNTTETLSPDGTNNATKFIGTGSTGVFKSSVNVSGNLSRSVYLKSVSGTTTAKFKDPNATGGAIPVNLTITNEWQRFELTGDNGTAFQGLWIDDITSDGLYMWGAQLESGSFPTSYIPTSGITVTRNQDQFTRDGIGSLINDSEGVLFFEVATLENGGSNRVISLSNKTNDNLIFLRFDTTANRITFFARGSGGSYNILTVNGVNQTDNNKIALVWDATNFRVWVNGSESATATINNLPVGMNTLSLRNPTSTDVFYGKVKQLQVYKTALTDEQLIQLTGTAGTDFYEFYAEMADALTYTIQ